MNKIQQETRFDTQIRHLPAGVSDLITPVSIYLRIRDKFPNAILLESSDYHGDRNSMTYICFDVISNIKLEDDIISISFPDGNIQEVKNAREEGLTEYLNDYLGSFKNTANNQEVKKYANGVFGYTSFDAVQYFENIQFKNQPREDCRIPLINYSFYRFIITLRITCLFWMEITSKNSSSI